MQSVTSEQNVIEEQITHLWILSAVGRAVDQGLLETAAPADDPEAVLTQRLLLEAGLLTRDPIAPSERMLAAVPPGVPPAALTGYVRELLGFVQRYVEGAGRGWAETDPALIRWRGVSSGKIAMSIFGRCFARLRGFPARLAAPGAGFLDVGTGAGGIAIELCQRFPHLNAVGLDINPPAVAVAKADIAAAGLDARIEVREQSVAKIPDVGAFDMIWVPQPFISADILEEALPKLFRAARPGAALIMLVSAHDHTGLAATATDLWNLMIGGGTLQPRPAALMLEQAGFAQVETISNPTQVALIATRP
ncbi:SAM-dependent methyltransferase [Actinomadura sp. 9N215]|uniref:SAM-dependent methyltransferase n=1 Tax=Actinomadura sp. 9N215 TaxID=3375150 RepID=UPI0037BB016F